MERGYEGACHSRGEIFYCAEKHHEKNELSFKSKKVVFFICLDDGQAEAYLKDMGMMGLASFWVMARRKPI